MCKEGLGAVMGDEMEDLDKNFWVRLNRLIPDSKRWTKFVVLLEQSTEFIKENWVSYFLFGLPTLAFFHI